MQVLDVLLKIYKEYSGIGFLSLILIFLSFFLPSMYFSKAYNSSNLFLFSYKVIFYGIPILLMIFVTVLSLYSSPYVKRFFKIENTDKTEDAGKIFLTIFSIINLTILYSYFTGIFDNIFFIIFFAFAIILVFLSIYIGIIVYNRNYSKITYKVLSVISSVMIYFFIIVTFIGMVFSPFSYRSYLSALFLIYSVFIIFLTIEPMILRGFLFLGKHF